MNTSGGDDQVEDVPDGVDAIAHGSAEEEQVTALLPEQPEEGALSSIVRSNAEEGQSVPLWLITFTDVMALMLTFFVLLYAMSAPKKEKWEEISAALSSQFNRQYNKPFNAGTQDTISIDRISLSRALDLNYLKSLVTDLLKEEGVKDAHIEVQSRRLIISLPSNLLFDAGKAEVKLDGKKTLFSLGGVLSRIKNRIEIIGHTDPTPPSSDKSDYETNWDLSLARATAVAIVLKDVGYTHETVVRGFSSARYDELPENLKDEERKALARRVDIVIMEDDGRKKTFMNLDF